MNEKMERVAPRYILFIFFLGVLNISLWQFDYWFFTKSYRAILLNDHWLSTNLPLLITIIAFYIPLLRKSNIHFLTHLTMFFLLWIISISCYDLLRTIFSSLYITRIDQLNPHHLSVSTSIWKLFLICFFVAMVIYVTIRLCQIVIGVHFILTAMITMITVIPISLISLDLLRMTGIYHAYSFMYAAQFGIPHFWAPILMGFLSTYLLNAAEISK